MPAMEFQKLWARFIIFASLIAVDLVMFTSLVGALIAENGLQPAIAALMGTVIGAVTTAIGLAAKDFFTETTQG